MRACARARKLGRPLLVVGAPDAMYTGGYGCGDIVFDIAPSSCSNAYQVDITKPLPLSNASVVVFVSCVLEYVDDVDAALSELRRVSGGELFVVDVEPWTVTAFAVPGTRRANVRQHLRPREVIG